MASERFSDLASRVQERFTGQRRVRSFWEFLAEVMEHPRRLLRSSAQYVRDMFEYFGAEEVEVLGERVPRHKLFDGVPGDPERARVVGQEPATDAIYRVIRNFAEDGRADRLILMHGPNGSSKTTIADLIFLGLEAYSNTPEGALYRFAWVFPKTEGEGPGLGFGRRTDDEQRETYAYLQPDEIAATLASDLKTNPIYLVPREDRAALLEKACGGPPPFPHEHILRGDLGTKSRAIYEALLTAFNGDWRRVMRYIRVERFTISRRYRTGAVTIEPQQANVDAEARQLTADMNLANLPPTLQNLSLFEVSGDVVAANRGVVEYSDFLKRPLELNKYLLTTTEKSTVRVPGALAYLDVVMLGSANEKHLDSFKTDPNFTSFKGRIELVTVPYLLEYEKEVEIYRAQMESIGRRMEIAPHSARAAALWAVLTRLWRPDPAHYEEPLRSVIPRLTPLAKALLYQGRDPSELEQLSAEDVKLLRDNVAKIASEWRDGVVYEGRFGASAREMKTILLDASYRPGVRCFTPMLVLEELRNLVKDKTVYDFLKLEPKGRYNNPARFVDDVDRAVVRLVLRETRDSMALVDEAEYDRRFGEYFAHAIAYTRGTRVTDPRTGESREPDPNVLASVESLLDTGDDVDLFRENLIAKIGAYSVGRPGERVRYRELFPDILRALKRNFYASRQEAIRQIEDDLRTVDQPGWSHVPRDRREQVEITLANMEARFGYTRQCALEVIRHALQRDRSEAKERGGTA